MKLISIFGRKVGKAQPCFVVAEAGSNHNGFVEIGKKLIDAAKNSGADAVKFQAFKTEELVCKDAPKAEYMKTGEKNLFEILKKLELSKKEHKELYEHAKKTGIPILWSVFDKKSVDMIDKFGVEIFKTGSGELTDLPLIEYIAKKGKPLVISTGMATLDEVKEAVETAKSAGNEDIILMHCTTGYPCRKEDANLRAIETLEKELGLPIGYSDHSEGIEVSLAAKILGACMIEKHFTLDKKMPGVDHKMSVNPAEFKELVNKIRKIENGEKIEIVGFDKMLGSGIKKPTKAELEERKWARKSIFAGKSIRKGTAINENMLAVKRPGTGISPAQMHKLVGKILKQDIKKGKRVEWSMIE